MAKRANAQGTVYKEADPARKTRWRAEHTAGLPPGIKRVTARGRTQAEALQNLQAKLRAIQRASPDADRLTLNQWLDRWLEHKRGRVKARTLREYRDTLRAARADLGHHRLARLKPHHIEATLVQIANDGHPAKANNVRRYLKQAFRHAERLELIRDNPLRNIPPAPAPPTRRGVWTPTEIQTFLREADELDPSYAALFRVALFAGLRRGELLALPWRNVTPTSVTIDRTHTADEPERIGSAKSAAGHRRVPIAPSVYQAIQRSTDRHLAFPSRAGTMLNPTNVRRAYKRCIEKSGVPDMRFHDLRRTAATLWAMQGHPPKVIQALLGHASPHLALKVYTDVYDSQLEHAALDPNEILPGA